MQMQEAPGLASVNSFVREILFHRLNFGQNPASWPDNVVRCPASRFSFNSIANSLGHNEHVM
jgi:hypothetical protein